MQCGLLFPTDQLELCSCPLTPRSPDISPHTPVGSFEGSDVRGCESAVGNVTSPLNVDRQVVFVDPVPPLEYPGSCRSARDPWVIASETHTHDQTAGPPAGSDETCV
ncbi:hypothetical protein AAFF_G00338700 [Aldrovandia affinis]|uniref:Uncharacterized protein n=1 Tax=Aldrovandia affinis TaxID=143900 RepID=A0AAD7R6N0_9TELE|nr:hypothetical protein AAFF_G00338700 [Aldrovandia affinis]